MYLVKEFICEDSYIIDMDEIETYLYIFQEKKNAEDHRNELLCNKMKEVLENNDKIIDDDHNIIVYNGDDREDIVNKYFEIHEYNYILLKCLADELFQGDVVKYIYKVEIEELDFSD